MADAACPPKLTTGGAKCPLYELTASAAAARIRAGDLRVEDYAQALIARVQEREDTVHAWAYFDPELVLENARALDAIPPPERGPLHGVAIGIKDIVYTADMPTSHSCFAYAHDGARLDAPLVTALRRAGALIFGKTHTTQMGSSSYGPPTANPHNDRHTPGGSSSGSAAAVADMHVPLAIGAQTAGSMIRPASYTGVMALKPTWNAISRDGVRTYAITLDTIGVFARSTDDLALVAGVYGLTENHVPAEVDLRGARFGLVRSPAWPSATDATVAALSEAEKRLRSAGAQVDLVELPKEFDRVPEWHRTVMISEARVAMHADDEGLDESVRAQLDEARGVSRASYLAAIDGLAALRPRIDAIAREYTALLTPSATGEAPALDQNRSTGSAAFNAMWTAMHVPVVNIPGLCGPTGLPVGISLVAPRHADAYLLDVAKAVAPVFSPE